MFIKEFLKTVQALCALFITCLDITLRNVFTAVAFLTNPIISFFSKHSLVSGIIIGLSFVLFAFKILFFGDVSWVHLFIEALENLVNKIDNFIGYKAPSQINIPKEDSIWLGRFWGFSKGVFAWCCVLSIATYSTAFCLGLSCGLNKLLLVYTLSSASFIGDTYTKFLLDKMFTSTAMEQIPLLLRWF